MPARAIGGATFLRVEIAVSGSLSSAAEFVVMNLTQSKHNLR